MYYLSRIRFYDGIYRKWITRTILTDTLFPPALVQYLENEGFEPDENRFTIQGTTEIVPGSLIYPRMVEVQD